MSTKDVKKLAKSFANAESLDKKSIDFVLKLNRGDLKVFLSNYKLSLKKTTVTATSATELAGDDIKQLQTLYKGKRLVVKADKTLGAGIKVEDNDNIIDFTFKKYINDTIQNLK